MFSPKFHRFLRKRQCIAIIGGSYSLSRTIAFEAVQYKANKL